jgi:hypothetical protein
VHLRGNIMACFKVRVYAIIYRRLDSVVCVVTSYWVDIRGIWVRFLTGARDFSLFQSVQTRICTPRCPVFSGYWYFSPGGKADVA